MLNYKKDVFDKTKTVTEVEFHQIYTQYYSQLYYFISTYIPQHDWAENIVQDTFMTFWAKKESLWNNSNIAAYLFTVAKNNCLQKLRNKKFRLNIISENTIPEIELNLNIESLLSFNTPPQTFRDIKKTIRETLNK
ncbi:MAG: hypothetical protein JW717_12655 [Marinilabiliaceae bacterium]|nr:hypothetical protein [Marinilabiliaceae bacterium]